MLLKVTFEDGYLLLDVGCGWIREVHQRSEDSIGIDLNPGLADVLADAQNLPFRDSIFSKVIFSQIKTMIRIVNINPSNGANPPASAMVGVFGL